MVGLDARHLAQNIFTTERVREEEGKKRIDTDKPAETWHNHRIIIM